MDEVSVDTGIKLFIRKCDAEGPPFASLLDGVPYSESDLRFNIRRISWEGFLPFMNNVGRTWTLKQLEQMGRDYARSHIARATAIVGKIFFSPKDFYKWAYLKGHAPSTFTCISQTFTDLGKNRLQIILQMKDGFAPCKEFFYISKGAIIETPCLIGYPESSVTMRFDGNSAVYDIEYVDDRPIIDLFRRAIRWPFSVWSAGRELKKALESLQASYVEIVEAHNNLEKRIEERTTELRQAQAAKDRIFTNISHEFRTPLTLIQGPVEKMLTEEPRKDVKEQYRMVLRNTRRLLTLVNQLLDLSKLDAGELKLHVREMDIVDLVRGIASSFDSLAVQKGIRFKVLTPDESIVRWFDPDCVVKIVTNLLTNAIKFTNEKDSVVLQISITHPSSQPEVSHLAELTEDKSQISDYIFITVTDTGIGMTANELDRIFDRFYQLDRGRRREYEGTGIGLTLTKELVELHKGEITVSSEPAKGSTFTVMLPLYKEGFKPDESVHTEESIINPKKPTVEIEEPQIHDTKELTEHDDGNLPLLLIVEDNADMRKYMRSCLDHKYRIIEAVNGEDGIEKAIEMIPDMVISDVMMPMMDGFELCNELKTDELTSHIPVILLTAKASVESKLVGLETGADDYITKPFDARELMVRVRNLIEQRKKLRKCFGQDMSFIPKDIVITSTDERFLNRSLEVVKAHISDTKFTADMFAKEMFFSRMQLHRKIKSLTGCSPGKFIRMFRLKMASQLLQNHAGTIAEIANQVGYDEPSHFTEAFRKQFGVPPSEYAKEQENRQK
jgi:signal transduction histidine kinase/DNA-binding response OmpR family regulator